MPQVSHVVAIDPFQERLHSLKQAFPGLALYPNLETALDHVDAVIIATPPSTHAALALTALASGKSVLVEKPLATSTQEARQMIAEAAARSLVLMVGHTFEYNAAVWKLRELVQSNELGRVYPCKVRRTTVVGSSKMAVYNDLSSDERIRIFDKGVVSPEGNSSLQNMPMTYRYGEIRAPYLRFEEPLSVQDAEFVSCVLSGSQPQTDGHNGLSIVQALECADISLRAGRMVSLEEVSRTDGSKPELAKVS